MTDTWVIVFMVSGSARTPAKTIRRLASEEPEDRELQKLMLRYDADSVSIRPPTTGLES